MWRLYDPTPSNWCKYGCAFYKLRSEDPNQHLKDFIKLVDSPDLNEQEDSLDTISGQLGEMNNTVLKLQENISKYQMIISELKERLCKKDLDNKHLKSKVVEELKVQVKELKSENEGLKLSVEELTKAHELIEVTLRQRDEMVSA
ncbi:hypothetical protein Tco_1500162 [Tanacetum coccineum]